MKIKNNKMKSLLFFFVFFGCLFFCFNAKAATSIYRSVGPANTLDLNTNSRTVTISGTTATFSGAMPNNVGVGDVLQYQIDTTYYLAFISGRTSSTVFSVQSSTGGTPQAASEGQAVNVYRAYTSLEEAESGTENTAFDASVSNFDSFTDGKDITSSDEQWNITCYGDAEDTTLGIVFQDWTTDADNYIKIYTPYLTSEVGTSQRHNGIWDDSKYKLVVSDDFPNGSPISINTGSDVNSVNVWIDGIQVYLNSMMGATAIELYNITGETKISNNIIKANSENSSTYAINISDLTHDGTYKIWNNIIYGFFDGAINFSPSNGSESIIYAHSNTAIGISSVEGGCYNHGSYGTFVAKNNIAQSCFAGFAGVFDSDSDYNLSDLADAPGSNSQNSATVTFAGAADYHLDSTDTGAMNNGTNLSDDANLAFSIDIDNQDRSNWDIGADEYVASDTTGPTIAQVTAVATPTSDTTPNYTFSSTEPGTITYGGDCTSSTTTAVSGNNTITFAALSQGTHSNCTIIINDAFSNSSNTLNVTSFTVDTSAPSVTAFTIPETSNSLTVTISSFTATDTVGVTGYLINESSATPSEDDPGWTATAPASYAASGAGTITLYAWAKDEIGNVSTSANDAIIITLPVVAAASPSSSSSSDSKKKEPAKIKISSKLIKIRGTKVKWKASAYSGRIIRYSYTLNGKRLITRNPYFIIPKSLKPGIYKSTIKAYTSTGKSKSKKIKIWVK